MKRFLLFVACVGALSAVQQAQAQLDAAPRKYAVLSLVGDKLTVVTYEPATGSSFDKNDHDYLTLNDTVFDKTALLATDDAIEAADAHATVAMLAASSRALYDDEGRLFDGKHVVLPAAIAGAVKESKATHLLLITKLRAVTHLRAGERDIGTGKLEGLGFYLDRQRRMEVARTGEHAVGYAAAYVYVQVSLVDLSTNEVVQGESITASRTFVKAQNEDAPDAWTVLTEKEKVDVLRRMLTQELKRVVGSLVKASQGTS